MPDVPSGDDIFITVGQVRAALGERWSPRKVRRWLERAGVLERRFGVLVTTPERLATAFPEIYRRLIAQQPDNEDDY